MLLQYINVLLCLVSLSLHTTNFVIKDTEACDLVRIELGDLRIDDRLEAEALLLYDCIPPFCPHDWVWSGTLCHYALPCARTVELFLLSVCWNICALHSKQSFEDASNPFEGLHVKYHPIRNIQIWDHK